MSRVVFGRVTLCRTCGGAGRVAVEADYFEAEFVKCEECAGSGLLSIEEADRTRVPTVADRTARPSAGDEEGATT